MSSFRRSHFRSLIWRFALTALLFLFSAVAVCAQSEKSSASDDLSFLYEQKKGDSNAPDESLQVSVWRMVGSTLLVLALIVLAAYLFRRFAPRGAGVGRSDVIHVIGTKMLGGRKSLMLVRVRGQTLLLGVTPQSIQCLTEIHEIEGEWAQPADAASSAFDRTLGNALKPQGGTGKA